MKYLKTINGFDTFKKYLLNNCKDKEYINDNLEDITSDAMLEAEHNVPGIDIEIKTSKETIKVNYNISYGKTSMDLIERFNIIKIKRDCGLEL